MLKASIKKLLNHYGYEIKKAGSAGFNSHHLSQISTPKTVIDVGVGYGTHPLYDAYPDAHFILVEPIDSLKEHIETLKQKIDAESIYTALGESEYTTSMSVDTENENNSTLLQRTKLTQRSNKTTTVNVPVTTLDSLFGEKTSLKTPILLKIDSEGCELDILKGGKKFLKQVETVICETTIADRFDSGYSFEDLIFSMHHSDFYLYSILHICHPEGENRPRFADLVFKKRTPQ